MNEPRFRAPPAALACAAALLVLFGAAPRDAAAQDTRIITFGEAVRIALDQNVSLRQSQNAQALGEVAVDAARNQFLPDLRLSSSGGKSFGRNFSESEGSIVDRSSTTFNLGVSSGITLFDGFANVASLRGARLTERASEQDVKRTRETVVFTVAANFLSLVQQQEQLRVQRESLTAEQALEQQIQTYVDAGARTIADLYQQQANLASARFAVLEAERAAELAKVDLVQTLQLDPAGVYEFEAPSADVAAASAQQFELASLLSRASEQRADLDAEEARVAAAEQDIRVARSNRWPTVALSSGYSSAFNSASDTPFSDQLDQRRGGSVSLGISLPLFDRGATRTATRRAEIQADSARLALEAAQNDVGVEVRRAYLDFQAAQQQLVVADAQVRAAQLALQAAQDRYAAGASTLVELSQSRASQVQAASALVSARYNLLFQRTLVDYYVGDLDPAQYAAR